MQSSTRMRSTTLDRSLQRTKGDVNYLQILYKKLILNLLKVNLSTFGLLFSEMVQYSQNRVDNIHDLQNK